MYNETCLEIDKLIKIDETVNSCYNVKVAKFAEVVELADTLL